MTLHNKKDRRILEQEVAKDPTPRTTLSFYKYHHITEPQDFRDAQYAALEPLGVLGRIYVAKEGINAQITVPTKQMEAFRMYLAETGFLKNIRLNIAIEDDGKSFIKLAIKLREKIVADGLNDETFDVTNRGRHLDAQGFNELTGQPETVVVDMRNHYEWEVGHFQNAILPDVDTFREALPVVEQLLEDKKDVPVIMYCTGGIRCEKASAWLKHRGFSEVYQLDGGIIEYARQVEEKGLPNKFKGKNFVFDRRLGERIGEEVISRCHQCGEPCDTHTNCRNEACHLLFIQCEKCAEKREGCCSAECQEFIHLPEEAQKELRKKLKAKRNVFRKGRGEQLEYKKPFGFAQGE